MRTRVDRVATACVLTVLLVGAGCAGSKSEQDLAIASAREFLETEDSLGAASHSESASHRRGSRQVWQVEFDTEWGHRCVELTSPLEPMSTAAFVLVRIESGQRCERLHYDVSTGESHELYWADFSAEAKAAYRRGFLTCRGFRLTESPARALRDQHRYLGEREFPRVTVVEAAEAYGCEDENLGEPLAGSKLPAGLR